VREHIPPMLVVLVLLMLVVVVLQLVFVLLANLPAADLLVATIVAIVVVPLDSVDWLPIPRHQSYPESVVV
jgi:hypothetical protein